MTTTVKITAHAGNHHVAVVKNNHNTTLAILAPGESAEYVSVWDRQDIVITEGDAVPAPITPDSPGDAAAGDGVVGE